ncbi:MAG: hypothetical protein HDR88_12275 [Bacteroides sp.]|nr:hypothetical protein [Bacteroides sp.]
MNKLFYLLPTIGLLASCAPQTYVQKDSVAIGYSKSNNGQTVSETPTVAPITVQKKPLGMIPKATAFRMTGDYANNVAVTLGPDGNLTYYPAPSDISKRSIPTSLGDGWYLNNQGLNANSVFTKYTFDEYSKLPSAPSPQQLKEAIIPGARVENMIQLPYSINDAQNNIQGIKDYLKSL